MEAIRKYLAAYAEPEAKCAEVIAGNWQNVVAIPLANEGANLPRLLASLSAASRKTLAVLVVNHRAGSPEAVKTDNAKVLSELGTGLGKFSETLDLWTIDRASAEKEFPLKQGVGLARKIGCDVALALFAAGRIKSRLIHNTDGDAAVDETYFNDENLTAEGFGIGDPKRAVYLHPYAHGTDTQPAPPSLKRYEAYLQYYVDGLTYAGSPYAFPTIGSTLTFDGYAYAIVRGFPKREAGEDFHLLNKLAQVGRIFLRKTGRVTLLPRESDRVPFGTGAAMAKIGRDLEQGFEYQMYDPKVFDGLRRWLSVAESAMLERDLSRCDEIDGTLRDCLTELGAFEALAQAFRTRPTYPTLRHHFHTWFDALKTLRLIHLLERDNPKLPWQAALASRVGWN